MSSYRYPGVHITNNLSWRHHVQHILSKANRSLGCLKGNYFLALSSLKLLFYTTYAQPQLEYASSVWEQHHSTLIYVIEAVQNRVARFRLRSYHHTPSVREMKAILNIPLYVLRRKQARILLFNKIYHHNVALHLLFIHPPHFTSAHWDHCHKVSVIYCNTVSCSKSLLLKTSVD